MQPLMERTQGAPEVVIGLIDGPVALDHAHLQEARVLPATEERISTCSLDPGPACRHGTFIAGMLAGSPDSATPGICPNCTFLIRPIFSEPAARSAWLPSAAPADLAAAIHECIQNGAHLLNLSLALTQPAGAGHLRLQEALDEAMRRGVLVAAAAGNQGLVGSSALTRHPWVIPVSACDPAGRPLSLSNLSHTLGRGGLSAPGHQIAGIDARGSVTSMSGTSAAVPFVTGALALLKSLFPAAGAAQLRHALLNLTAQRRSVTPPLLDAWAAYRRLALAFR